ncbi:hypothetical protein [uncultured Mucilaginibacter sp.]|nr:hypothetical protein [uncultured Mucilaginibacter sp.]
MPSKSISSLDSNASFTPINLATATKDNIEVDTFNYYIGVLVD